MIVKIVVSSVMDPKYSLPDGISNGTMAAGIHMQVYWCAAEMGMDILKAFAFKFMRASLAKKKGLTVERLKSLIERHKLFTPDFCAKAPMVPQHAEVLRAFATYIVAHENNFGGNSMYARLLLSTKGWLSCYLYAVKPGVNHRGDQEGTRV
jgi:hypothetical protein